MRVYVPTTPSRLPTLRRDGLAPGAEAYAVTAELADALDLPAEGARDEETEEDLAEVARSAAAEASLLLLAEEPGAAGRRVVLVAEARARPVGGDSHPATVVLTAPLRYTAVESLLADSDDARDRVARAAALVQADQDAAVARLERDVLGWFHPDEQGLEAPGDHGS